MNFSLPEVILLVAAAISLTLLVERRLRMERRKRRPRPPKKKVEPKLLEITPTWRQLEALTNFYREVDGKPFLPPLRDWAVSPDFLTVIAQHVRVARPKVIAEFGCGSSTIALAMLMRANGIEGHIHSIEHLPEFAAKVREGLAQRGLSDFATIYVCPLIDKRYDDFEHAFSWYDLSDFPKDIVPELLIVDGPPGWTNSEARYPAGPEFFHRLARNAHIFLDDAARKDEVSIAERWLNLFPSLQRRDHPVEKGLIEFWNSEP